MNLKLIYLIYLLNNVIGYKKNLLNEVFKWKQIGYNINGVKYVRDSNYEKKPDVILFNGEELEEREKYFIQYNNIPIGFEVYEDIIFITVPRRRYGIPSTLNYVHRSSSSPLLMPYPDDETSKHLVSTYRPRVDACDRLWVVDTGLLEVPGARRQVQPPSLVIFDLKTSKRILKYEFKDSVLVNNRTSGGLTSITVDVDPASCDDAYAYINDLATGTMIVFSLKQLNSWSLDHPTFKYDEYSLNFTVAGYTIPWMDNLFSIALSDTDADGKRKAYFHPLVNTNEYYVYTDELKKGIINNVQTIGNKGANTQSGSHAYHVGSKTLLFANVAQDAILCWNVDKPLTPNNVAIIAQDKEKLVYISDLKVINDDVWVLVNKIPVFVFSTLNTNENNFYIHKGSIWSLIEGTVCDGSKH